MASNKKVISLGLDYSQFDGGITEVNRKMGLLDSHFKLATEQTKEFGTETDKLTLKQEALTQKINLQTRKVELSKEAYDKATASGKASDKQLDNLMKAYNINQTSLQKLNNELAENKTKIDKSNKSTESFGDSIRGLASSIGLDVSPALEAVVSKFDGVNKSLGAAVLGIGAIIGTFVSFSVSTSEMADELLELSSVTGITTDELQKMQYASGLLDVEVSTMTDSMTKLIRNMDNARDGSTEQAEAFETLRVKYKDVNGELLGSEETFYAVIDALGKVTNETERDSLAMTLLGKSAKDLNPLIEAGSKRLKELGIEAEDLGVIMGGEALESAGAFNDAMYRFNQVMESVKEKLGTTLLPLLTDFMEWMSKIPASTWVGIFVFTALAATIFLLAKAASGMAIAGSLLSVTNGTIGVSGLAATAGMAGLLIALLAIAAVIALIAAKKFSIKDTMSEVTDSVNEMMETANKATSNVQSAATSSNYVRKQSASGNYYLGEDYSHSSGGRGFASGTNYYPGGSAWVGEDGPELVTLPQGSTINTNAESKALTSGGDTYNISINANDIKEFNNIVSIMQNYKQTVRQGRIKNV